MTIDEYLTNCGLTSDDELKGIIADLLARSEKRNPMMEEGKEVMDNVGLVEII